MAKKLVGRVLHYFPKVGVAVLELSADLKNGDVISFEGSTAFSQAVDSMQIEHKIVPAAKAGQSIGLKVAQPVREKDSVYVEG